MAVLAGLGLLSTSCGLPTDDSVRRPGAVQPDVSERRGSVRELPPPPQSQALPREVVDGFLEAQISGEDRHAVSRSYLLPRTSWADDAGVTVHRAGAVPALVDGDPSGDGPLTYRVSFEQVGTVEPDGAATVSPPVEQSETFRLVRDTDGEWRIDSLPEGLLLSTETRDAAFAARTVFFLPAGPGGSSPHLVADRQLVPVGSGPDLLVRRVLAPPSSGLGNSGQTAAPPGTSLVSPVEVDASGDAVVDLTAPADDLLPSARDALAAQLVWTLRQVPGLLRLRLLVEGEPLLVGRGGEPIQVRKAFPDYDPQGDQQSATGIAIVGGQLRAVEGTVPPAVRSATSALDLAVEPRSGDVALLTGSDEEPTPGDGSEKEPTPGDGSEKEPTPGDGSDQEPTLRVGSADGPLRTVTAGPGLASPTWGDGSYGVWLLRTGDSPAVLVTRGGTPQRVDFPGLPALDASSTLRVSRDGTRVLLVTGGQLLVARVVPPDAGVTGPAAQVPVLEDVRRIRSVGTVAADWLDATTLAVLVSETRPLLLLSIDELSQEAVNQPLQDVRAQSVAALGELPLLVGAVSDDPAPSRTPAGEPSVDPAGEPSTSPVAGGTSGPGSPEEARLFAGRPGQPFDIVMRDAVRPRYPG